MRSDRLLGGNFGKGTVSPSAEGVGVGATSWRFSAADTGREENKNKQAKKVPTMINM